MQIDIPVESLTLIAYACQEMAYRRQQQAKEQPVAALRGEALMEAEQYRKLAEGFYALNRQAQNQGNQPT